MSLITQKSPSSVEETVQKISSEIEQKGLKIFSTIKHGEAAQSNGLELDPTTLIIFGNPQVGTKLMQCDQRMGLELPMKILVWQDANGDVFSGFRNPEEYQDHYNLTDCAEVVQKVKGVMSSLIGKV